MSRSACGIVPADGKILILRLSSIGDILLTTPLLRILRDRYPKARIDFVIKAKFLDLMRTNPHLDRLWPLHAEKGFAELRSLKRQLESVDYDVILDLHNNFRTAYLRTGLGAPVFKLRKYKFKRFLLVKFGIDLYRRIRPVYLRYLDAAAALGIGDDGRGLEFFIDPLEAENITGYFQENGVLKSDLLFAVAPGAGFAAKRWPQEYFVELLQKLLAEHSDAKVLLLGDQSDHSLCAAIAAALPRGKAINSAGRLSLMGSAAALSRCRLFIGNDTGLMHMASALKLPLVAIFGPTTRQLGFFPTGEQSRVVEHKTLSCRPCTHMGRPTCPQKHFKCMREITPDQIRPVVEELLAETAHQQSGEFLQ
ncbi:MAG: glycosyltransferase family 9 protein [candidate division KSB1 bacterium]|nr:glycosyltransferase family 9 protein [candidate division KSB1 bacterium]